MPAVITKRLWAIAVDESSYLPGGGLGDLPLLMPSRASARMLAAKAEGHAKVVPVIVTITPQKSNPARPD